MGGGGGRLRPCREGISDQNIYVTLTEHFYAKLNNLVNLFNLPRSTIVKQCLKQYKKSFKMIINFKGMNFCKKWSGRGLYRRLTEGWTSWSPCQLAIGSRTAPTPPRSPPARRGPTHRPSWYVLIKPRRHRVTAYFQIAMFQAVLERVQRVQISSYIYEKEFYQNFRNFLSAKNKKLAFLKICHTGKINNSIF